MQIMTDSPIRFPGLFGDWAFTASSKALDIGNGIYWYGILIALGLVIAIWWCMNQKSKYGITEDEFAAEAAAAVGAEPRLVAIPA